MLSSSVTRLKQSALTYEGALVSMLLALALAIRLPFMPFQGYYHDLASYVGWGNMLVSLGFDHLYTVRYVGPTLNQADPTINYPPGTPYLFGALVVLYNHTVAFITHTSLPTLVSHDGLGPFIAKLPLVLADLATTLVLYREARQRHSQRFALLASASFAFSPALLYAGAIWGQTDGLVTLPLLVALFALFSRRYALAGVGMAITVLLKPQPVIFIPLVLLYLWRWTRREDVVRFTVALAATVLLALLPVMIPQFQIFDMLGNMRTQSYNTSLVISSDAYNFWWFIGYGYHAMSSAFLGVNSMLVGEALFGFMALIIGIQIWRHREPAYLLFGLAMEMFSFFLFMGGQHQRYLFLFIPLALASLIFSERKQSDHLILLYLVGTALCFLNMTIAIGDKLVGVSPMIPYVKFQPLSDFVVGDFAVLSWGLAVFHLVTFAYAMWVFLNRRFTPLALQEPSTDSPQSGLANVQLAASVAGATE